MESETASVTFTINGTSKTLKGPPDRSLLEVLREDLGLTGAKYGCGEGACGACTVLVDLSPERACVFSLGEARGRRVTTIEGLAGEGRLHPVQRAFLQAGAMQCGYCVPGMILSAAALIARQPDPGDADLAAALDGNLCRSR